MLEIKNVSLLDSASSETHGLREEVWRAVAKQGNSDLYICIMVYTRGADGERAFIYPQDLAGAHVGGLHAAILNGDAENVANFDKDVIIDGVLWFGDDRRDKHRPRRPGNPTQEL